MMKELVLLIKIIFNPLYWIMSEGIYSKELDIFCREAISRGENFTNITKFEATLRNKSFWIENHPYASFTFRGMRPSRRTKILLRDILEKNIFEEQQ